MFSESFLTPKSTDTLAILIWKLFFNEDYLSMDAIKNRINQLSFQVNIGGVKAAFYDLSRNYDWFDIRNRVSIRPGNPGYEYRLTQRAIHPKSHSLMVDYMKKEFEKEMITNDKERKELLLDLLHCEPIEILGIKTTLKDAFYVYEFYKNNSDDLEYQYRNNDTTHLYHLNGAKYSTAEIIRLSQYVKSNRLYTQFKSY